MRFEFDNFMIELGRLIASRAAMVFEPSPSTQPRSVWICDVDPVYSTDPATRLTLYAGSRDRLPVQTLSIQAMTSGSDPATALDQAQAVYNCFLADDETELRNLDLTNYRINSATLRPMVAIPRTDPTEPHRWAFNVDLNVVRIH